MADQDSRYISVASPTPSVDGGEFARLIATMDWSQSPLGSPDQWPQGLKAAVGLMLPAAAQIVLFWGPEFVALYNEAYAPTIGDKHPTALGRPARESWAELWDDLEPLLQSVRETGKTISAKDRPFYIERHGYPETVYFDISYSAVPDEAGGVAGVLCIVSETTERVKAQERLKRVFETEAVGVIFFNHEGVVVDANDAFLRMTGYTREQIARRDLDWRRMTPAEWVPASEEQMEKLAKTGRIGPYEKEYILASGERRWMLFAGRDLGDGTIAEYCIDTTGARQAADALRESEERLRLAVDNAEIGFWDVLEGSGELMWPARTKAMFGISPDVPVSMDDFYAGLHPDDLPRVTEAYAAAADPARRAVYDVEYRTIGKEDGIIRWVAAKGRAIFDREGPDARCLRVIGTAIDITERIKVEQALTALNQTLESRVAEEVERRAKAEEVLRQAQKMETVGQLSGGIAHDFNNLLQIIHGNLSLIDQSLEANAENAKLRRSVTNALTGTERAAALTKRLLAFSRRQPLHARPIDVNQLVGDMTEMLQRTLGETIIVRTDLKSGIPNALVDGNQLENAILNLAINARDAMPNGGRLEIATGIADVDAERSDDNPEAKPGRHVRIEVRDSGSGMSEEVRSRAVEPFFSTKDVGEGTGLGLSMVYGFVRQSGGHLVLNSREGAGTTVELYLPTTDAPAQSVTAQRRHEELRGGRGERILLCEDDDDVRFFSSEALKDLGYEVIEAQDAHSALAALTKHGSIDLLFTDVVLPGGRTGADLAREARKLQPDLKVLFTTGYARSALDREQQQGTALQVLLKPFGVDQLATKVRELLN